MARHHILIVEDEQDIASLIKHTLERGADADAQIVSSGDAALTAVNKRAPDLNEELGTDGEMKVHYKDCYTSFGRLVVCGAVAEYNAPEGETGPPLRPRSAKRKKTKRCRVLSPQGGGSPP